MLNRMSAGSSPRTVLTLSCCLACLMLMTLAPPLRAELPSGAHDWVCITDPGLADAFAPLAEHRARQGLSARVVTTAEIAVWDEDGPDLTSALRWFVDAAHHEWGARYVLLGGDQHLLPAPLYLVEMPVGDFIAPIDLPFACLDGAWDSDGDGRIWEWGEDAVDLEPELALGRLPVADAVEAAAAVAKTVAYEQGRRPSGGSGLVAATVLDDNWTPGQEPVMLHGVMLAEQIRTTLADAPDPVTSAALYQYVDETPDAALLTPESFLDVLASRAHDFVFFYGNADADRWSCGEHRYLEPAMFDGLAGSGHAFFMDANTCDGADVSAEGILEHLLVMPDGGAVGGRGHALIFYIAPGDLYSEAFWDAFAAGAHMRLGDVQNAGLIDALASWPYDGEPQHLTHAGQMLLGDPALILRPNLQTGVPAVAAGVRNARAEPNPFNPYVEIVFELDGDPGAAVPARVRIYDLKGRHVATPLDAVLAPGPQRVAWDAASSDLGSGVYFAQIRTGGGEATVRMVLIE